MGENRGSDKPPEGVPDRSELFGSKWEARLEEARARRAAALSGRPKAEAEHKPTVLPDPTSDLPQLFDEETGAPGDRPDIGLLGLDEAERLAPLERAGSGARSKETAEMSDAASQADVLRQSPGTGAERAVSGARGDRAADTFPRASGSDTHGRAGASIKTGFDLVVLDVEKTPRRVGWLVPVGIAAGVATVASVGILSYQSADAPGSGIEIAAFDAARDAPGAASGGADVQTGESPSISSLIPVQPVPLGVDSDSEIEVLMDSPATRAARPEVLTPSGQTVRARPRSAARPLADEDRGTLDAEAIARALEAGGEASPDAVVGALGRPAIPTEPGLGAEAEGARAALLRDTASPVDGPRPGPEDTDRVAALGSALAPTRSPLPHFRPSSIEALALGQPNQIWTDMRAGLEPENVPLPGLEVATIAPLAPGAPGARQVSPTDPGQPARAADAPVASPAAPPVAALTASPAEAGGLGTDTPFSRGTVGAFDLVAFAPAADALAALGEGRDSQPYVATRPAFQRAPFLPWTEIPVGLARPLAITGDPAFSLAALDPVAKAAVPGRGEDPNSRIDAMPLVALAAPLQRAEVQPWTDVTAAQPGAAPSDALAVELAAIDPVGGLAGLAGLAQTEERAGGLPDAATDPVLQRSPITPWLGALAAPQSQDPEARLAALDQTSAIGTPSLGAEPPRLDALGLPTPPGAPAAPPLPLGEAPEATLFIHAAASADPAPIDQLASDLRANAGTAVELAQPYDFKISQTQVRYFHAEDRAKAEEVAGLISARLRDFTRFETPPPVGTIELWLAGRGTVAVSAPTPRAEESPAPAPAQTAATPTRSQTARPQPPKPKISTSTMIRKRPSGVGRIFGGG